MVDNLTQQPTDTSQIPQVSQVPETPQPSETQSVPEPNPQPVETPPTQEPIVQEPVQPAPMETPITPIPENQPTPAENSQPIEPTPSIVESQSPQTPQNPQPISIPQFRFPFNGNFPLTFSFGQQSDNEEIKKKFQEWGINGHHGLDFGLPEGTEILAVDSGKIIQSGNNADFGISVTIQHSWGQSLYAHLQETKVNQDQEVQAGDLIGLSGQSGSAYGQHLHFAIKPNNPDPNNGYLGFIDPSPYLSQISPIPPIPPTEIPSSEPVKLDQSSPIVQTSENPQIPETPQAPVFPEAEIDRRAQEKLLAELEVRRQKANQTRQTKKEDNLTKIEKLMTEKGKINNDDVCDFLHVSQSTASNYLKDLVNQGKIKIEGKGKATIYKSMLS